jgi:hypothetical protein
MAGNAIEVVPAAALLTVQNLGEVVESTRGREVWTKADKKMLDRVSRLIASHGDRMALTCGHATCADRQIRIHVDPTSASGAVLRCGCTDRVFNGV